MKESDGKVSYSVPNSQKANKAQTEKTEKVKNPEVFKRLLDEALENEIIEDFEITPSQDDILKAQVVDEKLNALKPKIKACFHSNLLLLADDDDFYYQFIDILLKAKEKDRFIRNYTQKKPRLTLEINDQQFLSLYKEACEFEELCRILYIK